MDNPRAVNQRPAAARQLVAIGDANTVSKLAQRRGNGLRHRFVHGLSAGSSCIVAPSTRRHALKVLWVIAINGTADLVLIGRTAFRRARGICHPGKGLTAAAAGPKVVAPGRHHTRALICPIFAHLRSRHCELPPCCYRSRRSAPDTPASQAPRASVPGSSARQAPRYSGCCCESSPADLIFIINPSLGSGRICRY